MALVAIVGRPNVGKSTLFNRLTGARHAIVHDEPGVTRDRVYGETLWNGRTFSVVDTGGFVPHSADRFEEAVREQVHLALDEADVLLFVLDVTTGIADFDDELASLLRKTNKPVFVVANKADNEERRWEASTFYQLGLGEVYPVSATNGTGTGDLLDDLVEALPPEPEHEAEDRTRIAIVGRPNVGKSSLANALLGEERSIVTEVSGTTRDAVDSVLTYRGNDVVLVDTAGLRKRARVKENVEFYATLRAERAIRDCDVAVIVLDATQGPEAQDIRVLKMAEEKRKGLVIAVNKWDLVEKDTHTARQYREYIHERFKTLDYVPVFFISAVTKQRVFKLIDGVLEVARQRERRISTSRLNQMVQEAVTRYHPPAYRGQQVKIKYATQAQTKPPVFVFFCNHPRGITEAYRRYLERQLRTAFHFIGVPLTLRFKQK